MTDATSLDTDVPGLGDPGSSDAPSQSPSQSTGWLKLISDAEKHYHPYQTRCDAIDKQFANLERLAATTRDREIQLFWANISVMAPSCYSRPPVPVVVPRFKSDSELPRTTSEMLERAVGVMFEEENLDGVMRLIRDDLVILARGVPWLRFSSDAGKEKVCIDHADRKDWLCEPARNWKEVGWVAKRSWLTRKAAKKRFEATSGTAYQTLQYSVRKDAESETDDGASKAGIWEIWSKTESRVVWVAPGTSVCLDEGPPHLELQDFFPCPRPAFGTVERRGLVPVPDVLFYKDQLEEINELTTRIAAISEAIRARGFYSAGAGDVADAIEAAFKATSNNALLIPIANIAGLNGVALKDAIAWLPLELLSATLTSLITVRKELIQDVYEVTGLSDIMRGQTEAGETLGAQQLKSQYGSIRIKDKQDELTRVARDITRIAGEIAAENFSGDTLMAMSQMPLPSDAEIEEKAKPLRATLDQVAKELPELQHQMAAMQQEIAHASQDPEVHAMAAANPDQAQAVMGQVQQKMQQDQQIAAALAQQGQQAQAQLQELAATITIDKVVALLREQKLRPFILDIETDSTITPDENAAKSQATELVTAVGGYLKNALPLVQEMPQAAPMVAETLKFIVKPFRAGRELQGVIDKFADAMEQKAEAAASAPPPPNPEAIKAQATAAETQARSARDDQTAQADNAAKAAQAQKDMAEAGATEQDTARLALEVKTAAEDADLTRRVKAQQELDASDARRQELADKAAAAALALQNAREKHAQDMDKGALEMRFLRTKIAAAGAASGGDGPESSGSAGSGGEESDIGASGLHSMMQTLHDHNQHIHASLHHLAKTIAAPNVIQRDETGRVIGSHKVIE